MDRPGELQDETYNPWSIVNLVFHHLAEEGLHPILGTAGDPGPGDTGRVRPGPRSSGAAAGAGHQAGAGGEPSGLPADPAASR
jgi:hypothetical protein